jgi:hypothetical protein
MTNDAASSGVVSNVPMTIEVHETAENIPFALHLLLLFLLILYEVISCVLIYRLWTRKIRPGVVERCVLSLVLLIPLFGWAFYGFLRTSPDPHGEDVGDRSSGGGAGDIENH